MCGDVDAEQNGKGVIEPDDLHQERRAAEQLDIGDQQPVDHAEAAEPQEASDETDDGAEKEGADGVEDGEGQPEPEQMAVLAEDREVPNVVHGNRSPRVPLCS